MKKTRQHCYKYYLKSPPKPFSNAQNLNGPKMVQIAARKKWFQMRTLYILITQLNGLFFAPNWSERRQIDNNHHKWWPLDFLPLFVFICFYMGIYGIPCIICRIMCWPVINFLGHMLWRFTTEWSAECWHRKLRKLKV